MRCLGAGVYIKFFLNLLHNFPLASELGFAERLAKNPGKDLQAKRDQSTVKGMKIGRCVEPSTVAEMMGR